MSSTNHTTNYNLPQFVGSDKPAWLGDINPAFEAIDTQMKANATTAAQGVSDAGTAATAAGAAQTTADNANTAAGTAQRTADQAVAGVSQNAGKIAALENVFKLTDIDKVTNMSTGAYGNNYNLTLAQNSDGSVFKFYGHWQMGNNTSSTITVAKTAVAGYPAGTRYGFATGVFLNTAPDEPYIIIGSGIGSDGNGFVYPHYITVGTDGQIYLQANSNQNDMLGAGINRMFEYMACIYFNTNFGDDPSA